MGPEPTREDWAAYHAMRRRIREHRKATGAGTIRARITGTARYLHARSTAPAPRRWAELLGDAALIAAGIGIGWVIFG